MEHTRIEMTLREDMPPQAIGIARALRIHVHEAIAYLRTLATADTPSADGRASAIRIASWVATGILGLLAILLALRALPQPQLVVEVLQGQVIVMPLTMFVVAGVAFLFAWACLLVGATQGHWLHRVVILLAFIFIFGGKPVVGLAFQHATLDPLLRVMSLIQSLLLVAACTVVLVSPLLQPRAPGTSADMPRRVAIPWIRSTILASLLVLYYLSAAWYSIATHDRFYVAFFPKMLTDPIALVSALLIPVPALAAARYVEWGQILGERVATILRHARSSWPVYGLTFTIGAAVFAAVLEQVRRGGDGVPTLPSTPGEYFAGSIVVLVFGALCAALGAGGIRLLDRMGHIGDWADTRLPTRALALPFAILVIVAVLSLILGTPAFLLLPVIGVISGAIMLVRGRQQPESTGKTGLYLVSFGLFCFTASRIHWLVGPATVIVLLWLLTRGRRGRLSPLVSDLLVVNIGVLVLLVLVAWYGSPLYGVTTGLAQQFTIIQAALLLPPIVPFVLGAGAPDQSRAVAASRSKMQPILALGYGLLAAVAAIYIASLVDQRTGIQVGVITTSDTNLSLLSLEVLGTPLLVATFVIAVSRSRQSQKRARAGTSQETALAASAANAASDSGLSHIVPMSDPAAWQSASAPRTVAVPQPPGYSDQAYTAGQTTWAQHANMPPVRGAEVAWQKAIGPGITSALLALCPNIIGALEVARNHGATSKAIDDDFITFAVIATLASLIACLVAGFQAASTTHRLGLGVLSALLAVGCGWTCYGMSNLLLTALRLNPLQQDSASRSVSNLIVNVVAIGFVNILLALVLFALASVSGLIGAALGRRNG